MQVSLLTPGADVVIVPFAGVLSEAGQAALRELRLPRLQALLAACPALSGLPLAASSGDADPDPAPELTLSPPHERALAAALGLQAGDGRVPMAALLARAAGWPQHGRAWGRLTLAHWQLGTEQISMLDPAALHLDAQTSHALLAAVRPLFVADGADAGADAGGSGAGSDGIELRAFAPGCWLLAHPVLDGLACASLDRVVGRNVDLWLGAGAGLRLVRRLQNEVQMLLHRHPVNEAREARGDLPVNSFWLDGCGRLPASVDAAVARVDVPRAAGDPVESAPGARAQRSVTIDDSLRGPALAEDWHAWSRAFGRLDDGLFAHCLERARAGAAVELTLCGERRALTLRPGRPAWWQRLRAVARPADPLALLQAL
jgi:hypothetical protein